MVDTGERLRNLTVKMTSPNSGQTWSGFIIGSTTTRTNRVATIIMSCTHALRSSNDIVLVSFHGQNNNFHSTTKVWYMPRSDILVVVVLDYHHTYDYLRFPNVYPQPVPMPILTRRQIHFVGYANSHDWIYHHGHIASELGIDEDPSYDNDMTVFGLRGGVSRGCSGAAVVDDALDVFGIIHTGHDGNVFNILSANPLPLPPNTAGQPPPNVVQMEGEYRAYLDANTTVLHDLHFVAHNNVYIPNSSLSFAVSVFHIDAKIRERVPNHGGLPLNQVVVNYVSQDLRTD